MRNQTERDVYERELQREREIARSNTAATNGLLIGIMIAVVAGAIAVFYALNESSRPPETQIITPPSVNVEQPPAVEPPDINITAPVIEPPAVEAPDVNITTPEVAPEATAPTQPAPEAPPQQ
jgi:hypothetical protein